MTIEQEPDPWKEWVDNHYSLELTIEELKRKDREETRKTELAELKRIIKEAIREALNDVESKACDESDRQR